MAENEINEMEICLTNHPAKQSIDEVMELANIQTIGGVQATFHFTHFAEQIDGCDSRAERGEDTSVKL